jgi:hypothetical protein
MPKVSDVQIGSLTSALPTRYTTPYTVQACHGQTVERPDRHHERISQLLEGACEHEHHAKRPCEEDGDNRRLITRMDVGEAREEQTVIGHGEEDARRRQHDSDQRAECRQHHDDRDEGNTDRAHERLHRVGRDQRRSHHAANAVHVQIGCVRGKVDRHDGHRADDDRSWQRSDRVAHFTGSHGDIGEAVVGPQCRDQCEPEQSRIE